MKIETGRRIGWMAVGSGLIVAAYILGRGDGFDAGVAHAEKYNAAWTMNEGAAFADLTVRGGVFNESTQTADGWRVSVFLDGETFTATAPSRGQAMIAVNAKSRGL